MSFTLFPKLPPEVRATIWIEAVKSQNRIVEVHWASGEGFTFHARTPALLSVCFESRAYSYTLYHESHIRRKDAQAPFCFERDVLYFPYPSSCSTSYGMALESFLGKIKDHKKLRHLALSIPFPENHLMAPMLVRGGFFTRLQAKARRSCNLWLETLTLVIDDPIMGKPSPNGQVGNGEVQPGLQLKDPISKAKTEWEIGVTKEFKDVSYSTEDLEAIGRITEHFEQVLKEPHDRWDFPYPQAMHRRRDFASWGLDLKISVKHANRIPGDFAVGTCSMKPYWVETHKKKLRAMQSGNIEPEGTNALPSSLV